MAYRLQGDSKSLLEFMNRNIKVYRPIVDDGVDLLIEIGSKYYKIQCKTSTFTPKSESCVVYDLTTTFHNNSKICVKKYTPNEVDYFFLYSDLYPDYPCIIPYNGVKGNRTINIDYSTIKKHSLKNHYKDYNVDKILSPLCVETLY